MNLDNMRSLRLPSIRQEYTFKDSILYALGLGYGTSPLDAQELQFVYENGQKAVPSQCVVLGYPGFWLQKPELEVDWVKLLHGEHYFEIHQPLKPAGSIRSEHSVPAVDDKGDGKGALVYVEKKLFDEEDQPLATIRQTLFLRGDGGCGSFGAPPAQAGVLPDRDADASFDIATSAQLALIYRLSGDFNPIHADPAVAVKAGFDRPILMGLCTMGLRMAVADLKRGAKLDIVEIPYKTSAQVLTDLKLGSIQLAFVPLAVANIGQQAGFLRTIAVTSDKRWDQMPDLPAISEEIPGFVNVAWTALSAPAGTPQSIVEKLQSAMNQVLDQPDTRERWHSWGAVLVKGGPQEVQKLVNRDLPLWASFAKDAGITPE